MWVGVAYELGIQTDKPKLKKKKCPIPTDLLFIACSESAKIIQNKQKINCFIDDISYNDESERGRESILSKICSFDDNWRIFR